MILNYPIPSTPNRGFTLVETLVAITILMIAVAVPFYSIQQAISVSNAARDELIASSLAQEGAEYIYFVRDNNYFQGNSWLTGMDDCTGSSGCTVDPTQPDPLVPCPSGAGPTAGCAPLKLSSTNLYTQSGSFPTTKFTRQVKLTSVVADRQERVTVTVTWKSNHQSYTITIVENLYNWI